MASKERAARREVSSEGVPQGEGGRTNLVGKGGEVVGDGVLRRTAR